MEQVEGAVGIEVLDPVERPLAERECRRRLRQERVDRRPDGGIELGPRHGAVHEAQLDGLGRLDHPAVGSCFDTANAVRTGDDPVESATELARWVMMLHLKDVEPLERQVSHVSGPCSVPFGSGVVDLHGVLDALDTAISAGAAVCIELGQLAPDADEDAMIRSGLDWLRERALSRR